MTQILLLSNLEPGARLNLTTAYGNWCFTADSLKHVYIVLVATHYPSRLAYALINEIKSGFESIVAKNNGIQDSKFLADLAIKYNTPRDMDNLEKTKIKAAEITIKLREEVKEATSGETKVCFVKEKSRNRRKQ